MTVPGGHVSERQSNCGKFCIFKLQKIRKYRFWGEMAGIWDKPNCFVEKLLNLSRKIDKNGVFHEVNFS